MSFVRFFYVIGNSFCFRKDMENIIKKQVFGRYLTKFAVTLFGC